MKRTKKFKSIKLHVVGSRLPAIVDVHANDELKLSEKSWHLNSEGHVVTNTPRSERSEGVCCHYLSRVVLGLYAQERDTFLPKNPVRHINKDKLDCRESNLIACTWQQIAATQKVIRKNNTSGYRGVSLHKHTGKWHSIISPNKKQVSLGYYDDPKEAAKAYDLAAIKYFGEHASINGVLTEDDI
jgi:hypothetical protein